MIVPMKKAKIVVLQEDKEAVLKALQRVGELMVIKTEDSQETLDSSKEEAFVQRTQRSLQALKPYVKKKGMFDQSKFYDVDYQDFVKPNYDNQEVLEAIEKADESISRLKAENDACEEFIKSLLPWENLDGKLSVIYDSKYTIVHTGFVPTKLVDEFMASVKDLGNEVSLFGSTEDSQAVMIVNWKDDDASIMEQIKSSGFIETSLPNENKTIKELVTEKKKVIDNNLAKIVTIEGQLSVLSEKEKEIQIFSDQMETQLAYKQTPVIATATTAYFEGWVKASRVERLKAAIESATKEYDMEVCDPTEEDDVPVALENNKFSANFEPLTDMYSRPSPKDIDPNTVMSLWYWVIFGMMMADVGYGLILAIGSLLMIKLMKPKGSFKSLLKVFFYGSITTIIWGVVFGSYFGVSELTINGNTVSLALWFNPQNDPITMLIFTLVIGVFHLSCGLIMKFIVNVRNKQVWSGIFDNISWVLILIGLSLGLTQFCANMLPTQPVVPSIVQTVGFIIAGVGALIVLCTAGREKKGVGKVIGGVMGLYGITSYLSDILSYARILALAMSSAIIGYVMNLLAGMVGGVPIIGIVFSILIYIIGHVFNIAMSLLSAYVHDCRLQYIEFYGKFYEGGGTDFKPLSLQYKYIYEINDKK